MRDPPRVLITLATGATLAGMRNFLRALLFSALAVPAACSHASAAKPLELGAEPRLFVDGHLIERMTGLERTLHQPKDIALNPVIRPERPWEHRRIPFGSVIWFPRERKFRCWYLTLNIYDSRPGFRGYRKEHHVPIQEAAYICYAESDDGVNWTKPLLRLHEFRGSKENNIVLASPGTHFDSLSVMKLSHDEDWPYRMMAFIGRWPYRDDLVRKRWGDPPPFGIRRHGHFAFRSKDGLQWEMLNQGEPVLRAHDRSMFWWDKKRGIFAGAAKRSHAGKRAQAYAWSRDLINWTMTPNWIHRADELDHPRDEGEAAYCFPYGAQWLGFAEMRRVRPDGEGGVKINWELLSSPDGRLWKRPVRKLFFADAGPETWRHQVFKIFANPPIERNGRLLIYYGGKTGAVPVETGYEPFQALCLATLRKDGFVSLNARESPGSLTTKSFIATGNQLLLNLDVHEDGEAKVEVLAENEKTLPGFGEEDCPPIRADSLSHAATWNAGANWKQLEGKRVRLRILLRDADLYSIWSN